MSEPLIQFSPVSNLYLLLISIGLVYGFILRQEYRRTIKFRSLRLICASLMCVAMLAILLRPSILKKSTEKKILLTPHYDTKQVDSLLEIYPSAKLFHTPNGTSYQNSNAITFNDLTSDFTIDIVLGEGLPAYLEISPSRKFSFLPATYPAGILDYHWQGEVSENEIAALTGIYNNPSSEKVSLKLVSAGGTEDSVIITKKGLQPFTLSCKTKLAGNFIYTIVTQTERLNREERIPLHVNKHRPLKIFFVQGYPTAESQYLKSFLSKDHSILVRTSISKNTFHYEAINRDKTNINRLTKQTLNDFDLIFIDSDALQNLTNSEANILKEAVSDGLGVIIIFNDSPLQVKTAKSFTGVDFTKAESDTAHIIINKKEITIATWQVQLEEDASIQSILSSRTKPLMAVKSMGTGAVGLQLVADSYKTLLHGDSSVYITVWNKLIEQCGRKKPEDEISIENTLPLYIEEPINISLTSSIEHPDLWLDSISLPLKEDPQLDGLWHTKAWSSIEGWHILRTQQDTLSFYIHNENEWKAIRSADNIFNTRKLVARHDPTEEALTREWQPISPLIFYLMFLIAAEFLWLAPKL